MIQNLHDQTVNDVTCALFPQNLLLWADEPNPISEATVFNSPFSHATRKVDNAL